MFNNILRNVKASVLEYKQCYKLAQQCRIDTHDEMNATLRFLHENFGVIRYYNDVEELRECVIKGLQYLFNMILLPLLHFIILTHPFVNCSQGMECSHLMSLKN